MISGGDDETLLPQAGPSGLTCTNIQNYEGLSEQSCTILAYVNVEKRYANQDAFYGNFSDSNKNKGSDKLYEPSNDGNSSSSNEEATNHENGKQIEEIEIATNPAIPGEKPKRKRSL